MINIIKNFFIKLGSNFKRKYYEYKYYMKAKHETHKALVKSWGLKNKNE